MQKITKAVIPIAGLGSRFLPATKAYPKEMLPIVDKPILEYAVEEAIAAGITDIIFVISKNKLSIANHFSDNLELSQALQDKPDLLSRLFPWSKHINCFYVVQDQPKGLGHAILCAKQIVAQDPFAVILPDDLLIEQKPLCLSAMIANFNKDPGNYLAVMEVAKNLVEKYGIISPKDLSFLLQQDNFLELQSILEKPKLELAPSNLAVIGRYVLTSKIFAVLETQGLGHNNEIQLTDALNSMCLNTKTFGYIFSGTRFDCGDKLEYLKATIKLALKHSEIGIAFRNYLKDYNN